MTLFLVLVSLLGTPTTPVATSARRAWCTAKAAYSQRYENYEVLINSNQPHRSARVKGTRDGEWSYETNSKGYADVYLYAIGGQRVNVTVGKARCSTVL